MKRSMGWLTPLLAIVLAACHGGRDYRRDVYRAELDTAANHGLQGNAYGEMRKDFPADYEAMRNRLAELYAGGASDASMNQASVEALNGFVTQHAPDVVRAPPDALVAIDAQRLRIYQALRDESTAECAALARGETPDLSHSTPATLDLIAHMVALDIRAARAGMDHPTTYPRFAFTKAETAAMAAQFKAQGPEPTSGEGATAQSVLECAAAVGKQRFIATLAPERTAAYESTNAFSRVKGG